MELIYKELTETIIGGSYEVYNELGYGFLEKVYENALMLVFADQGLFAEQQKAVPVYFRERIVGEYVADILVEKKVIVEVKTIERMAPIHYAQILNYLKATSLRLGLLINFGPKGIDYKRVIK